MRKILLIIILLTIELPYCVSQNTKDDAVFIEPENMPEFGKADNNEFILWTYRNLKYPEKAIQESISGKVYIEFLVDSTGTIKEMKILRSAGSVLDNEVLRVIETSPKWRPARQQGKNISFPFSIPIEFDLKDKEFRKHIIKLEKLIKKSEKKKHTR